MAHHSIVTMWLGWTVRCLLQRQQHSQLGPFRWQIQPYLQPHVRYRDAPAGSLHARWNG